MRYEILKREFQADADAFREKYGGGEIRLRVIATLAFASNDGGWPLGMLEVIAPGLARSLQHWTAGGYASIRRAQELGHVVQGSPADILQTSIEDLPAWRGRAVHLSKSLDLFDRVRNDRELKLRSFMSCSAPPFTTAYVAGREVVTLKFTKLRTARLIGALSTENLEREVLLPPRARFALARAEAGRVLILHEMQAPPHAGSPAERA